MATTTDDGTWSDRERQEELDDVIATKVQFGCRVESRSDFQAVLVRGRPVNHVLHFLIGLCTLGLWWIVWAVLARTGGEERLVVSVSETGGVLERRSV